MTISKERVVQVIYEIAKEIKENRQFLTDLDAMIGDGDHGINMARGFEAVEGKLDSVKSQDIGSILKTVGMTLVSSVGGASGPLYGTAFMKAGQVVIGKDEIDANDIVNMIAAAVEGIKQRGKGEVGDKTMLDVIVPSLESFKNAVNNGKGLEEALGSANEAAKIGVEKTKELVAKKGRASYLGERSLGFQDPGATSAALMFQVFQNMK